MDQVEEPSEELVYDEGEQPDTDDQSDRQYGRRNPFLARRPRYAAKLGNDAADEVSTRHRLSRSFLLFVHQRITSQNWQGGQDSNLQQLVLETRTLPIELPPSTFVSGFVASPQPEGGSSSLPVRSVAAAEAAVFAQLQPFRRLLLVFLRVIVAALALGARQYDHYACFFLCHP
jgi:hypothetical protein